MLESIRHPEKKRKYVISFCGSVGLIEFNYYTETERVIIRHIHLAAIDFSTIMRDNFQWARFGYTIHNQFWRQGFGKESVKAAISLVFEELHYHRIEAHINLDNTSSIKLAESVGMQFEWVRKDLFTNWMNGLII